MVRLSANLSWLFKDAPFLARAPRAAACKFSACEFLFDQYAVEPAALNDALQAAALDPVLLNAPPGTGGAESALSDWAAGERGTGGLPDRESDFCASVETALRYATAIGCPSIHAMAGTTPEAERREREATFARRLRWASDAAAAVGVRVCIEPLNARDAPGYLLSDTAAALRVLDEVERENCSLQLDLYHLQVSEGDLSTRIAELLPRVGHVQVANPPGRHEPGCGEVHFPPLFELLDRLGYAGWVGCEYVPSTQATEESLHWAREYGVRPPPP